MKKKLLFVLLSVVIIGCMPSTVYSTYCLIMMEINEYVDQYRPEPAFENPYEQLSFMDETMDKASHSMPIPIVILFTSPYCGYCPPIDEAYKAVANEYDKNQVFLTICDIKKCPKVGNKYVGCITPGMVVKKRGKVLEITGEVLAEDVRAIPEGQRPQAMKKMLDKYLEQIQ